MTDEPTPAEIQSEWLDHKDDVENGPIQNPLGVPMAPDQRITMLVNAAREVVKETEPDGNLMRLLRAIESLQAVLQQFEDVR